eukprot:COSAG06_NODE_1423_length_9499_cov_65.511967_7_plen_42_part_00
MQSTSMCECTHGGCLAACVWGRGEGHLVALVDLDVDLHAIV